VKDKQGGFKQIASIDFTAKIRLDPLQSAMSYLIEQNNIDYIVQNVYNTIEHI